jgi:branched-chain amino acid transport system substrate-binding protein
MLFTVVDAASLARLASSCKGIGYSPVLMTGGIAISPSVLQNPTIQSLKLFFGNAAVPFTATGTPALDQVHAAFKQFMGQDIPDEPAMYGWTSGMILKAAIDALGSAARNGPITTAMVKQGLYLLKNETLGGLVPPLTYINGQPSPVSTCYTALLLTTSGLSAPNGSKFSC